MTWMTKKKVLIANINNNIAVQIKAQSKKKINSSEK